VERQLRHLGYALSRHITDDSPYSLALKQLQEDFRREGQGVKAAGLSPRGRLAHLRAFTWERLAAIDHLSRDGEETATAAVPHTTIEED
jgi:hypothetical protein